VEESPVLPVIIRIGLLVISWSSAFFLPKKLFVRYSPVAVLASLLVLIECYLAIPFKWWKVNGGVKTKLFNELSFILGPFFVGTIWIFRLTFGKLWLYLLLNLIMDGLLSFPFNKIFQKLKVYKLINFKPKHIFFTSFAYAIMIYGYQLLIDKQKK
jgi:hypothetical protein